MPLIPWNGPTDCPNCGEVRFVHDGIVEKCLVCGDDEIDVAAAEEVAASMPVMVENKEEINGSQGVNSPT